GGCVRCRAHRALRLVRCGHCLLLHSVVSGLLECARVVHVIPPVAIEGFAAGKVLCFSVPAPEPREALPVTLWLLAAVLVPLDFGSRAKNAGIGRSSVQGTRRHERAYVDADPIVDIRLPADGLLAQLIPAYKNVVGWLSFDNLGQLVLQVPGG